MYSTMMVLYHCFNPTIPIIIHTCNQCGSYIVSGKRWHCSICSDYDLCDPCKVQYSHEHELTPFDLSATAHDESLILDVGLISDVHA